MEYSSPSLLHHRGRPAIWSQLSFVVLLAIVALPGCEPPGKPDPADRPRLPDQILDFDKLYATHCAGCHGANGILGAAPPLNDPLFAAIIPGDELLRVIRAGRGGTPMPAFSMTNGGPLTEAQVAVLAQGIKSHWSKPVAADDEAPGYRLTKSGASDLATEASRRGAEIFTRACSGCHGTHGMGRKGRDATPAGAINSHAFLTLISDQALRRLIITGRPDLGMPSYDGHEGRPPDFRPLSSSEIDDLVALLAAWRATD